jgi:hypothetical protein
MQIIRERRLCQLVRDSAIKAAAVKEESNLNSLFSITL